MVVGLRAKTTEMRVYRWLCVSENSVWYEAESKKGSWVRVFNLVVCE